MISSVCRKTTLCLGEILVVQIVSEEMHVIIYRVCFVSVYVMVMMVLILNLQLKCQALLPIKITRDEDRVSYKQVRKYDLQKYVLFVAFLECHQMVLNN